MGETIKTVPQRRFTKGLISTAPDLAQVPGSVPRISGLNYKKRGALSTIDGSQILSQTASGTTSQIEGPWIALGLYQPLGAARSYVGLKKDYTTIGVPAGLALSKVAGGALVAGTYAYRVSALDGDGGETTACTEVAVTLTAGDIAGGNKTVGLTWTANTLAVGGYKVYGRASGVELFIATISTNSYNDTGAVTPAGALPASDTSQVVNFYAITQSTYSASQIVKTFPADSIRPVIGPDPTGSIPRSGGSGGGSSPSNVANPYGGLAGNLSPLPQMVPFVNGMVLCLGNGYAPQFYNGSTVVPITNTFVTSYPDWIATTSFNAGDLILPTVGNAGSFVFQCKQAGKTGAAHPTWPQTTQVTVSDSSAIWVNTGQTNTSPAPIGAAHGIVHAGSFWAFNTSPTNTSLDGPSALRMSDINNPNSWNPLNAAFIGKDDGTQGTGLASFTIAEAGIPPTASLVVFKEFSTYQITGVFGSSNFAIQQVQTDMGCIAPRSIQFLPGFGIVRLTHLGFAVFDGVRDKLISEEIRPHLFGGISDIPQLDMNFAYFSKGSQTAVPPQYVCAIPVFATPAPTAPTSSLGTFGVPLAAGNWYWKASQLIPINGITYESQLTAEQGPITVDGVTQTITATVTPDASATRINFYYGPGPGLETQITFLNGPTAGVPNGTTLDASGSTSFNFSGNLKRILTYDLVLKAWSYVDLPFAISTLSQIRSRGTIPVTIMGGFQDSCIRRWQAGDVTWDGDPNNPTPVQWFVRTPEVFGANPSDRTYFRRLIVRGTVTTAPAALTVVVKFDGTDDPSQVMKEINLGGGQFEIWVDLHRTALNANATIMGSGPVELESFDWHAVPKPPGAMAQVI